MYRVRVYGNLDDVKLAKIREGVTINGRKYGPYHVEVEQRQTRNTWLTWGLKGQKMREIKRVLQKFSLRANRCIRIKYGPYKLGKLDPGSLDQVEISPPIKLQYFHYMRQRIRTALPGSVEKEEELPELGQTPKVQAKQIKGTSPARKAKELPSSSLMTKKKKKNEK